MKIGIIVVIALFASAFAAHFLLSDPGYVVINFRGYVIEMSVPVLVLLTAFLFFLIWLIRKIIIAPRRIGEAAGRFRSARSGQKLTRGMIAVAEGNFARGEKMLARAAVTSDSPLFNYLQAARAAHLQGRDERRDEWLRLAYQETPEAANAVLLTQAEFQLDRKQHEQALATLKRLDENSKDHGQALALLGASTTRSKTGKHSPICFRASRNTRKSNRKHGNSGHCVCTRKHCKEPPIAMSCCTPGKQYRARINRTSQYSKPTTRDWREWACTHKRKRSWLLRCARSGADRWCASSA